MRTRYGRLVLAVAAALLFAALVPAPSFGATMSTINAVSFVDANNGYIAGKMNDGTGFIWRTSDGGASWTKSIVGSNIVGLSALDLTTSWAVNYFQNGAYLTSDSGSTWNFTSMAPATGLELSDIDALPNGVAVAVGRNNNNVDAWGQVASIWRTDNFGASWTRAFEGPAPHIVDPDDPDHNYLSVRARLSSVDFAPDNTNGWAIGDELNPNISPMPVERILIYRTSNAGSTWTTQTVAALRYGNAVSAVNASTAWIGGSGRFVALTTNGGVDWTDVSLTLAEGGSLFDVRALYASNESTCVAVGSGGKIAKTTDGGDTWTLKTSGTAQELRSVTFVGSTGYAAGGNLFNGVPTLLKSTDSGDTWTPIAVVPPVTLVPVYRFYNIQTGVHFYTASETEKANVIAKLSAIFKYEGVAYQINAANPANANPLYRFYNTKAGVHFYTASEAEKNNILAKLSSIYKLEGVAYKVALAPANAFPIHRFYNIKKGVHFYTASETEKANVIKNLSATYKYEGVGYYIGN